MKICKNCGSKTNEMVCPDCGLSSFTSEDITTPKPKKKRLLSSVLITIISIILLFFAKGIGSYIAKTVFSGAEKLFSEKSFIEEIEEINRNKAEYNKGIFNGNTYISSFLDLEINFDENWIIFPEDEIKAAAEIMEENAKAGAKANIEKEFKNEEISPQLIEKLLESLSVNGELAAGYVFGDYFVGDIQIVVCSLLDYEDSVFPEQTKQNFSNYYDNVSFGSDIIAGVEYEYARGTYVDGDNEFVYRTYGGRKNGYICYIYFNSLVDFEEEVLSSLKAIFHKHTS